MRALTQNILQVTVLEIFDIFVLAEEILVDVSPSEQPHIRVIGDGPVCVVGPVQSCALSLSLHWCNQEGHAKEPQQLLGTEEHGQLTSLSLFTQNISVLQTLNTTNHSCLDDFLTHFAFIGF